MTFKVGDRVYYSGDLTEELVGKTGTIKDVINQDHIRVDWDQPVKFSSGVMSENLDFIREAKVLDPAQASWDAIYKIPVDSNYCTNYEEDVIKDAVNHPDHYNNGGIECIEYLKDNMSWQGFTGYLEGNCKKYLHRWRYKQKPLEDLKKARWYLDRLISELETEGNDD